MPFSLRAWLAERLPIDFLTKFTREQLSVPLLEGSGQLPAIAGSASLRERTLTVTLTNPSAEASITARLRLAGATRPAEAQATGLSHADPAAANTFTAPEEVAPRPLPVNVARDVVTLTLPRQSAAAVQLRLA